MTGKLAENLRFAADDDEPLAQIFQFANIARPVVLHHAFRSFRAEATERASILNRVLSQQVIGQHRNLIAALAQRRQKNGDHVDAIQQVLAEQPVANPFLQQFIGGATTRTSTATSRLAPRRENVPSCNTCSSLACNMGCISAISSRKIVPWFASSNLPGLSRVAPVNAPAS